MQQKWRDLDEDYRRGRLSFNAVKKSKQSKQMKQSQPKNEEHKEKTRELMTMQHT
jgi:hypothetical protein